MITVVVLICRILAGTPICHEEIVARGRMTSTACQMYHSEAVDEWKEVSKFKGKRWRIEKTFCSPGNYQKKDAI